MPLNWRPTTTRLEEEIAAEQAKIDAVLEKRKWQPEPLPVSRITTEAPAFSEQTVAPTWQPIPSRQFTPTGESPDLLSPVEKQTYGYQPPQLPVSSVERQRQPSTITAAPPPPPRPQPAIAQPSAITPAPPPLPSPQPAVLSPWQRALQIFAAPFNWIDENIIIPGEALIGTGLGITPEVKREAGEDYWQWKKRSWEAWETPGININVPWSDEPWRIDVKGVLEFAPWLLIPGAGQVGGAAGISARLAGKAGQRAARGLAGVAGKGEKVGKAIGAVTELIPGLEQLGVRTALGQVTGIAGRVVGTAIEYSPWGLAEKTVGVAIKGGFRAVGAVSERMSTAVGERIYGKYTPPPVSPAVAKITKFTEEVTMPAFRKWRKAGVKELRTRQQAAVLEVQRQYKRGEFPFSELKARSSQALKEVGGLKQEFALTQGQLAIRQAKEIENISNAIANGEISEQVGKGLITRIRNSPAFKAVEFTPAEGKELGDMILRASQDGLWSMESSDAFVDWIFKGVLPEKHNLGDWAKVFGRDFAKAVGRIDSPSRANQVLDALNIPRAIIASWDVSATARQGLILSLLHPTQVPKWFGRQVKGLFSEKWALEIDDVMRADPLWAEFAKTGAYVAPLREATFTTAEEMFASRTARVIPGIRRSERAFATYLNQARFGAFKSAYNAMTAQGATDAQFKLLGEFLDIASGRGRIPESLDRFMPALNLALFSPRLQAATLQLPRQLGRMLLSDNPYMRKEAAKALVTFVGGGVGLLSLLNNTGVAKVETDPRSGDFGKIKIGETRLDIWRGYVQYARFAAQLLSGERKSAYGNMNKAERGEIAWRFIQSKASPAFGLMVDLFRGELYFGEPIFNDTTGFIKAAREKLIPLAVQDIIDAMEMNGVNGLWTAAPATLGIGVLTYVNDFVKVKEKIAGEMGYKSWDDIDPKIQRQIENRNTELQAATIAFDRQMMGTAWGDWRLSGKAIDEVFGLNVENAVNKFRQSGEGVQFRKDISDAWTERRGAYKTREREARFEDIVKRLKVDGDFESLTQLGPEQKAIKTYNDALFGDDMFDEFGDYRYDEADIRKAMLRQSFTPELWQYLEDYQTLKWETFPPEFQTLQEAKKIMKPYWAVADTVARLFGQRYAESPAGQRLITKRRKQMRLQNPALERAYQLFYSTS